ncbi:MAG: AraC family transcriptional regulator [Haliscomenobacteraceae bacterium CHB4]|nr:AraC family transcriptional regulator [Haliscomenobacteraceae bacterium CHB4]
MIYQQTFPSPLLQPFIVRYYQVNGIGSEADPYLECTLPNGYTSLVFHFEEKIKVSNVRYDGDAIPHFYIFGKYTAPIFVRHTFGKADVFGVIFKPAAFYHFFDAPQQELTDQLVDVKDGLGKEMDEALDRMYRPPELEHRKTVLETFFLKRLAGKDICENVVDASLAEILHRQGNLKVQDLAKRFRVTRQHLNRLFLQRIGLNVKDYSRTIRFNAALRALTTDRYTDLMQAVADFGYCDESHLIKDFHHFTGGRPSDFLGKENALAKFLMGGGWDVPFLQ